MPGVTSRASQPWLDRLGFVFPFLIVLSVVVMLVPLPPLVLDLLLACNITIAVMVLLTAIQVRKPLDFSVFPALLLGTTLSRLVLNIASTRLILTNGATQKQEAAGGIIQAFGDFVTGGNLAIGLVLFVILLAIQFLVITKGATRISEVAARFTLDGLPGKQLAIDADLNAGVITQTQARQRRDDLSRQADFYGSMDGASKFVRGDALAGLVITGVNLLGGMYVGLIQNGMSFGSATEIFSTLTIGDGLVSQIPAFLIALAAGFLVTRSSSETNLSQDAAGQLLQQPVALSICGGFLLLLSFTGLPQGPLMFLGAGCLFLGFVLQKQPAETNESTPKKQPENEVKPAAKKTDLYDRLQVEPLELVLGIGLLRLTRTESGNLLSRLTQLRQEAASELGVIVPSVRVRDELVLERNEYRILMKGVEIARGTAYPDGFLALETPQTTAQIPGIELASGTMMPKAKWIESKQAAHASEAGYRVVDPVTALMIHFGEIVREHAAELLSRQQVYELLDRLKQSAPRLVEDLVPAKLSPVLLHQVLTNLLRERVPIRDLETILQELDDRASDSSDPGQLTEHVRASLAGTLCEQYRDAERTLWAITLSESLETQLLDNRNGSTELISASLAETLRDELIEDCEQTIADGKVPVVICDQRIRRQVKQWCESAFPRLAVLGRNEITRETRVEMIHQLGQHRRRELERVAA